MYRYVLYYVCTVYIYAEQQEITSRCFSSFAPSPDRKTPFVFFLWIRHKCSLGIVRLFDALHVKTSILILLSMCWGVLLSFVADYQRGEVACGKHRADGEVPCCRLLPWRRHEGPGLLRADGISRGAYSFYFISQWRESVEVTRGFIITLVFSILLHMAAKYI